MLTVVLYGKSLALSSVGAGLRARRGLHVVMIDATVPRATAQLRRFNPDAVVFDMAATQPDIVDLWRRDPDLLLIGVNVDSETALVFSSASSRLWTANDLVEIIRRRTAPAGKDA
jgi:hypothetical protein